MLGSGQSHFLASRNWDFTRLKIIGTIFPKLLLVFDMKINKIVIELLREPWPRRDKFIYLICQNKIVVFKSNVIMTLSPPEHVIGGHLWWIPLESDR